MSISSSINAFKIAVAENRQFRKMGGGSLDLLHLHYRGRFEERFHWKPQERSFHFRHFDREIRIKMSAPYLGAFKGVFLDAEYDCRRLLTLAPKRILDLGANIGMGAISLASQYPKAEIACVEPDPRNVNLLEHNLRENKINATVLKAAIGPRSGTTRLRFGQNPTCSALASSPMHDLDQETEVDLVTVAHVMDCLQWSSIDLVKIDIEGAEDELFSADCDWLHAVGAMILEIHPNTTPDRIQSQIESFRFSLERTGNGREPVYFASKQARHLFA